MSHSEEQVFRVELPACTEQLSRDQHVCVPLGPKLLTPAHLENRQNL